MFVYPYIYKDLEGHVIQKNINLTVINSGQQEYDVFMFSFFLSFLQFFTMYTYFIYFIFIFLYV